MSASPLAIQAAAWVLDLPDAAERARLYGGHMIRRRPSYAGADDNTDHTEADAWLISQWERANHQETA